MSDHCTKAAFFMQINIIWGDSWEIQYIQISLYCTVVVTF